mgnify:CR=1 FL=1
MHLFKFQQNRYYLNCLKECQNSKLNTCITGGITETEIKTNRRIYLEIRKQGTQLAMHYTLCYSNIIQLTYRVFMAAANRGFPKENNTKNLLTSKGNKNKVDLQCMCMLLG